MVADLVSHPDIDIPLFIVLYLIVLWRYCIRKKNYRFVANLFQASLLAPFFLQYLLTLWCLCITFQKSHNITNFFIIIVFLW